MATTYKRTSAATVDEYLQPLPDKVRMTLEQLRKTIKSAVPKAEEKISYQIPGYYYLGPLVFFAAFKNHCSLFAVSKSILKTFEKELHPFKIANTTIHFTHDHPLPSALVKKMVRLRIKENEERKAGKIKAAKSKKKQTTV